jgi:hypothetical protein
MIISMLHLIEDNFFIRFFFDIITFFISLALLIYYLNIKKVNKFFYIFFILSIFTPFFFNNLLFEWSYFPDQSKYLRISQSIRNFEYDIFKETHPSQLSAGIIYALFPTPVIYSFTTTSIISRTLFLLTLLFVYRKHSLNRVVLLFFFLCPSIILYTSVGLRETFIFAFLILAIFFLFNKKNIYLTLICISYLTLLKAEIALMLAFVLLTYCILFSNIKNILKILYLFLGLVLFITFREILLEFINYRYKNYFHEEYNFFPQIYENFYNIIISLPKNLFKFILSPGLEVTNIFKFIQTIENVIIYIFLFFYFYHSYSLNKLKTLYWLIVLFFNISIYSLVVVNAGSIARFKITLFILIILCLNFSTKKNV